MFTDLNGHCLAVSDRQCAAVCTKARCFSNARTFRCSESAMSSVLRDNAVLVQAANEDADVDVTGDAADYVTTSFARDEVAEKTSRQGN